MAGISFNDLDLRPLVKAVIAEVLAEQKQLQQIYEGRLAYREAEAASMLGLNQHQLRDLRRDGKISHTRIVGRQIRYTLQDLMDYLNRGRVEIE
jgi:excisionase family DNA binding protein